MGIVRKVEWKLIPGFPDYEMDKKGNIREVDSDADPDYTHDGKGNRLVWLYNERGRIDLRTPRALWEETWPEMGKVVGGSS